MTNYKATALLLNWKRPKNLIRSIDVLREMDIEILLWNNNPDDKTKFDVDMQINADQNQYCWARWEMATHATTPYVFSLDDDLMFSDKDAINRCIDIIEGMNPNTIIGYTGVSLNKEKNYRNSFHINSPISVGNSYVDIVKGRFMFMNKDFCTSISINKRYAELIPRADDIYISSKSTTKIISSVLYNSIKELPEGDVGLWMQQAHYPIRQQATDIFFSK
jgi:hypothetical protein